MEVFEGADFVRLRTEKRGGAGGPLYAHADEDGRSVRLDPRRAAYSSVWAVQRRVSHAAASSSGAGGTPYVLLRGAYGRYLGGPDAAASPAACGCCCPFPCPCLCCCPCRAAAQRDFDEPEVPAILWRAVATGGVHVLLHDADGRYLRADCPRCLRSGVAVSACPSLGTAVQWAVEVVPRRRSNGRPELPIARDSEWFKLFAWVCPPLARICARWFSLEREIRWVPADGDGGFSEDDWASLRYVGRPAILLRTELVHLLAPPLLFFRLTLCIRAGRYGQPSPLSIDLPRSREPLDIVVFRTGTRGDDALIFPDLNAEPGTAADNDDPPLLWGPTDHVA